MLKKLLSRARPRTFPAVLLATIACALVGAALPAAAAAADPPEYTVDSSGDQVDEAPGTGGCKTTLNTCTLRAAIEESNALTEAEQTVVFGAAFDGQAADTITLGSALPPIEDRLTINGIAAGKCATAAGVNGPCVDVDGPAGGVALKVESEGVSIKGLAITGALAGIELIAAGTTLFVAQENWIGTKLNGVAGANGTGIKVVGSSGVPKILANKVQGSPGGAAIAVVGGTAEIAENKIVGGLNAVHTSGGETGSTISGNTIEGSEGDAILIENDNNSVLGNQILGAGAAGVRVHSVGSVGPTENIIGVGGFNLVEDGENTISNSAGAAIELNTIELSSPGEPTANRALRNKGSGNGGPFIDLVAPSPGTEPNGPNNGIEPPEIESADKRKVTGNADSEAYVRVYRKTSATAGEIQSFIGFAIAEENGEWELEYASPLPAGTVIAANQTVEEEGGGSSELATATTAADPLLTVTKSGSGAGTVTSSPAGITCGGDCSEEYLPGTEVTLSASGSGGSSFKEWTGACSGSAVCKVTMSAARAVTAVFDAPPVTPAATCATDPTLCPAPTPQPKPAPQPKPLKCKKGFKKTKVKGKTKCVKIKKSGKKGHK